MKNIKESKFKLVQLDKSIIINIQGGEEIATNIGGRKDVWDDGNGNHIFDEGDCITFEGDK